LACLGLAWLDLRCSRPRLDRSVSRQPPDALAPCDQERVRIPLGFRLRNGGLGAPAIAPPPTKTSAPFIGPAGAGPYHFSVGNALPPLPSGLRWTSRGVPSNRKDGSHAYGHRGVEPSHWKVPASFDRLLKHPDRLLASPKSRVFLTHFQSHPALAPAQTGRLRASLPKPTVRHSAPAHPASAPKRL